jgi:hypothetical protein
MKVGMPKSGVDVDVSHKESNATQWSEVVAGRRKTCSHTLHRESKPIPVILNWYEVLNHCHISEYTNSGPVRSQLLVRNRKLKSKKSTKVRQKILIIGDSHASGIASKMQHNLDEDFEIQGIVKPGADLAAITHTVDKVTGALTKQDALVVWGGSRDVSRNESLKGLDQTSQFVESNSQTNVVVVNVPHRFDLETKAFNRTLSKLTNKLSKCNNINCDL